MAALEEFHVDPVVAALSRDSHTDPIGLTRALRERSSTNLIHHATHLKVDLFIAGGTALDTQQLAGRRTVDVGNGRMLPFHPPEDILLQKLRWYQRRGRSSDRQWPDIQGIIRVQRARLDRAYLREHALARGVETLLIDALSEHDMNGRSAP